MDDKLLMETAAMDDKLLLETAVLAGEIMLVSGAEVYRVEDTMRHILLRFGYDPTALIVLTTGIFATLDKNGSEPVTIVRRISDRSTNINRIYRANDVSRRLCSGKVTVEAANEELVQIAAEIQYGPRLRAFGLIGVAAFFAPMFGGGLPEFLAAGAVGVCLAWADRLSRRLRLNDFCANALCAAVIAAAALALTFRLFPQLDTDVLIISAIMPLVPGVVFTTAIRDTLNGDYAAGMARALEAVVAALAVAAGVGGGMLAFRMLETAGGTAGAPAGLLGAVFGGGSLLPAAGFWRDFADMAIQVLSAFFAVLMFALVQEVPKKHLPFAALTGAVGWWTYVRIQESGNSSMLAAFLSTLVLALFSQLLARFRKSPVTVFLIPGILPAVPGAAIYRCVYYLLRDAAAISTHYLVETLQIAGAMAMAIFMVDSVFRLLLLRERQQGQG